MVVENSTPTQRKTMSQMIGEETQTQGDAKSPRSYKIGGMSVDFPYKAYGSQLAFMGRVIAALDKAQRQGHCNALLESPTGTGKSLSLLCATLAWQKHQMSRASPVQVPTQSTQLQQPMPMPMPPPPTASQAEAALISGGGFIPENTQQVSEGFEQTNSTVNGTERQPKIPTIFYASRTHSQITQVIREYKKTSYRVPMAVLASRKHYCTNNTVCKKNNVDEECKLLLKQSSESCHNFKNAHKVKHHFSVQKGGCNEVHDIEDLVKVGHSVKGCSYFAARDMAVEAKLVFCPYSYIIHPVIRKAMEVDIKGDIIILDEAHNIEDMTREAGSLDADISVLEALEGELCGLKEKDEELYQPLLDMILCLNQWITQKSRYLEKRAFEHFFSCWTGERALKELQAAGISLNQFPILRECAEKAIKEAADKENEGSCLSGLSATTVEGLFSSLSYFFSDNGRQSFDYQLCLQRFVKREEGMAVKGWTTTFSLWCLNPSVVFKEIAEKSLSVILTSGTLSPMNSFASELGVPFEISLEAPHVIDLDTQVWAAAVASGPNRTPLNASYKTADSYEFQDALGSSLEEICKVVPNGVLVFFPSYKLMDKLCNRWKATGQWQQLNQLKSLFIEPRGGQDDFEPILNDYYGVIRGEKRVVRKLKGTTKKMNKSVKSVESGQPNGQAALLAVFRGKVSEGIDFSDENARAVVIVGIPFPNTKDIQIALKKKYNETFKSSKHLLSGDQWYCFQAFRALNQAVGRCIRHRNDFGAVILLDERFKKASNLEYMSKWIRSSIGIFDNFEKSVQGLQMFFRRFQDQKSNLSSASFDTVPRLKEDMFTNNLKSEKDTCKDFHQENGSVGATDGIYFADKNANELHDTSHSNVSNTVHIENHTMFNSSSLTHKMPEQTKYLFEDSLQDMQKSKRYFATEDTYTNSNHVYSVSSCITREAKIPKSFEEISEEKSSFVDPTDSSDHLLESGKSSFIISGFETLAQSNATPSKYEEDSPCSIQCPPGSCNSFCEASNTEIISVIDNTPEKSVGGDLSNSECTQSITTSRSHNNRKFRLSVPQSLEDTKKDLFGKQCNSDHLISKDDGNDVQFPKTDSFLTHQQAKFPFVCNIPYSEHSKQTGSYNVNHVDQSSLQISTEKQILRPTEKQLPNALACYLESTSNVSETEENNCSISCKKCGCQFGLQESQFSVPYLEMSLKKSYINILRCKNRGDQDSAEALKAATESTSVIVCDVKCLSEKLLKKPSQSHCLSGTGNLESQQKSAWVEEDGCVFRAIHCPQCGPSNTCVGAHVLAADVSNLCLLDKAVFLKDFVNTIDMEVAAEREPMITTDVEKDALPFDEYAFNPKRQRCISTQKIRMRLPRKY